MQETLGSLFDETVQERGGGPRPSAGALRWRDESGASFAFHLEDKAIAASLPFFDPTGGLSRWRVRTTAALDDGECAHCGGAECDDPRCRRRIDHSKRRAVAPLPAVPGVARTGAHVLARGRGLRASVELFADEEDFRTSHRSRLGEAREPGGEPLRIASEAFLPLGMFESKPDVGGRATALFSGRVEAASSKENSAGGGPFWHVRVASLPGPIDVVVAGSESPRLLSRAPSPWLKWLVGRPDGRGPSFTGSSPRGPDRRRVCLKGVAMIATVLR